MPEIQFPDEIFPLTETPGDPVVVTLDLNRISGIKWEDCKLKIELKPRKAKRNKPVIVEAQHGLAEAR